MKRTFIRYILGIIPVIALYHGAYAQENNPFSMSLDDSAAKEIVLNTKSIGSSNFSTSPAPAVNAKALKDFGRSYKKAPNTSWSLIQSGFLAEFKSDDIQTCVFYDPKGRWTGTLRTYQENKLPNNIRHLVKSQYYDYKIYLVHEVTVDDKTAYLVKMEDDNSYKTVRVMDGELIDWEYFKKAK